MNMVRPVKFQATKHNCMYFCNKGRHATSEPGSAGAQQWPSDGPSGEVYAEVRGEIRAGDNVNNLEAISVPPQLSFSSELEEAVVLVYNSSSSICLCGMDGFRGAMEEIRRPLSSLLG